MLELPLPTNLRGSFRDDQASKRLYAVHDGFVRHGTYIAAGSVDTEDEWNFNDIAMQDMLDNFSPPAFGEDGAEGSDNVNDDGTSSPSDDANDDGTSSPSDDANDEGQDQSGDAVDDGSEDGQDDGTGAQQDDGSSQPG